MTDHSRVDVAASGVPYTVRMVNGRAPESLEDFSTDNVEVVVTRAGQELTIRGSGRRSDDRTALVHEKTLDGIGKDVRTWTISVDGAEFTATERSVF